MFKRVQFEEWQALITIVAFILCSLTFIYLSWRAIRMSRKDRAHMANLPLESEDKKSSSDEQKR